jgi:hypothetical protein
MSSTMSYSICLELSGMNFIFSDHTTYAEAEIIAKKVFVMGSPPQVFSVHELIRVCELLNCLRIKEGWIEKTNYLESNGIFSVGIIENS